MNYFLLDKKQLKNISISKFISVVLFCLCLATVFSSKASDKEPNAFKTPKALSSADLSTSEGALKLLQDTVFQQQLHEIANKLPNKIIDEQVLFHRAALRSIRTEYDKLNNAINSDPNGVKYLYYTLHSNAWQATTQHTEQGFLISLDELFSRKLRQSNDDKFIKMTQALNWSVSGAKDYVYNIFKRYHEKKTLTTEEALNLISNSHLYHVLARVIPTVKAHIQKEQNRRFAITPEILITTDDGVELAATIVRKKATTKPLTTAMQFTIYADEQSHIQTAMYAAAKGYVGIVVNSRGKRSSRNAISPWEHDGKDANTAISWIIKQPWSNGDVVMYGGSYNGFTQWAAVKNIHPALKAIAPYSAASLITGLPYENNIVLTGNYQWAFHVTNNKTMDHSVYADWQKSSALTEKMFKEGHAISAIDKVAGEPNPWFQKWLTHTSFDEFYQAMVPIKQEYANINIPVLTVTGYFDGGQISALDYLTRHNQFNKNADHTLLIGPYNHGTAQHSPGSHHSNYKLDEVALEKDTQEVVFAWFDHLLHKKKQPSLLKGKINYQLMGSNTWKHTDSMNTLNKHSIAYYLATNADDNGQYPLTTIQEDTVKFVSQTVDLSDRSTEHNKAPWPVIQSSLGEQTGLVFMTPIFDKPMELSGQITGEFSIAINKKDADIGYNFYEIDKDGNAFHLNTYRSRASHAHDMTTRHLLTPHKKTRLPIVNARMTAKLLEKGSRLAIVLDVNKNRDAQVNMGTGNNVNNESIKDAGAPLQLKWFNDSKIFLPLKEWQPIH